MNMEKILTASNATIMLSSFPTAFLIAKKLSPISTHFPFSEPDLYLQWFPFSLPSYLAIDVWELL